MSFNHVVIWLDHEEAHLIYFNANASYEGLAGSKADLLDAGIKTGIISSGATVANALFFKDIVQAILDTMEILLVGPANEKHQLMQYMIENHRYVAEKIVGVVNADHPTEAQLISFARRYFRKIDQMRTDPIASLRQSA